MEIKKLDEKGTHGRAPLFPSPSAQCARASSTRLLSISTIPRSASLFHSFNPGYEGATSSQDRHNRVCPSRCVQSGSEKSGSRLQSSNTSSSDPSLVVPETGHYTQRDMLPDRWHGGWKRKQEGSQPWRVGDCHEEQNVVIVDAVLMAVPTSAEAPI